MFSLCRVKLSTNLRSYQECATVLTNHFRNLTDSPSAGIIIVGDEILKARVRDTNSYFMCSMLYEFGVRVKKISIIGDDVNEIAKEIQTFSQTYKYVITSGGIGPTHDDVTYAGLAKAFNDSLHYHPTLVDVIRKYFGNEDLTSPDYKMAYIPTKASLKFGIDEKTGVTLRFPCIILENVHVFPGSPVFFEKSFYSLCKELFPSNRRFARKEVYIDAREESFANALSTVAKEFPRVCFGSYPVSNCSYYKVFVTIESVDEEEVKKATDRFCKLAPSNIFVEYDPFPQVDCIQKYEIFCQKHHHETVYSHTLNQLKDVFFKPEKVAICFDCSIESIIILHLAYIVCSQLNSLKKLQIIYFKRDDYSSDTESFIKDITKRYNVDLYTRDTNPYQGIQEIKVLKPELSKVLLGLREINSEGPFNDLVKNGKLAEVDVICPLVNWTSEHIWTFAKSLSIPCYQHQGR